jgi:mono/diheme cytochrome c family protein
MARAFQLAVLSSLFLLAVSCTEQQAADRIATRQQSPTGDANPQLASPETMPSSPAIGPEPDEAPTREDLARAHAPEAALQPQTVSWSGGDAANGHALYGMYCLMCHGAEGKGDGPAAAALDPKPRDFTTGRFYIDANANDQTGEDVDLARVIRESPGAFGGSPSMPAWKSTFSEAQVRDLVAYVHQLAGAGEAKGG